MPRLALLALATCLSACTAARRGEFGAAAGAARGAEAQWLDAEPIGLIVRRAVDAWRTGQPVEAQAVRAIRLPEAEQHLREALKAEGARGVSSLFVLALSVRVAAPPPRAAAHLLDVAEERAAVASDEAKDPTEDAAGLCRMRLAMLNMGQGPFRFDFRWTVATSLRPLEGGRLEVRYDLAGDPPPERVSLFHGIAVLEPDGQGSRWTEVLAIGSPITPPPFLVGAARAEVERIMTRRAQKMAGGMK